MRLLKAILGLLVISTNAAIAQKPASDIQIVGITCINTSIGPKVEGEVKNTTERPFSSVEISEVFLSANGSFVSTSHTYARFRPLLPGQTSPFEDFGDDNPAISTVQITPANGDDAVLSAEGINTVSCK